MQASGSITTTLVISIPFVYSNISQIGTDKLPLIQTETKNTRYKGTSESKKIVENFGSTIQDISSISRELTSKINEAESDNITFFSDYFNSITSIQKTRFRILWRTINAKL